MPTWFSVKGKQGLEFRRGFKGMIKDPVAGIEAEGVVKPLKVTFEELLTPFPVFGLPGKDGLARGILTPGLAVKQIRSASTEIGPSIDKLPKGDEELADWIIQKMRNHRERGALFVEVADNVETAEGADLEQDLDPAEVYREPIADPAGTIVQSNDRAYCRVCDRTLDKRGVNGHRRSKEHHKNMAERDRELRQASGF